MNAADAADVSSAGNATTPSFGADEQTTADGRTPADGQLQKSSKYF